MSTTAATSATLPLTASLPRPRWEGSNYVAILLASLLFSGLSAYLASTSESDLEADATTHFLMARYALKEHHYLTDVWGRPLCTAVYALPARIGTVEQGRFATRLTSLAMALIVAAVTYLIAKRQGFRRPALVWLLLLAQPVFFLHSFSELTEIPFAIVLMLAFLAYQRKQWLAMAALTGLLPLGRPEGFGFIVMAAAALLAHRRARWLWILPLPFLAWTYAGWFIEATAPSMPPLPWYRWLFNARWPTWVFRRWPYSYQSMYGRGFPLSFVGRLPVLVGPLIFPFTLVGLALELRWLLPERRASGWIAWLRGLSHERRCEFWIVLIPLSILIVHSILWWRGKMGSNGELRYLVIVGPFFAIAGARGWEWIWTRFDWKAPLLWAGVAALLPASVNKFYKVVPLKLYEEGIVARDVARWYGSDAALRRDFPRIMPTMQQVYFYMDLSQTDKQRTLQAMKPLVEEAPPGTLMVWDPIYGQHNSNSELCNTPEEIEEAGWIPYRRFACADKYAVVYLSPKTAKGKETAAKYHPELPPLAPGAEVR
jgi:hypothetical protein